MEFVSFQNVNHFVPKQAEKEQKQSADRESFQDIMKKAPEQAQTEKSRKTFPKARRKIRSYRTGISYCKASY